MSIGKTQMNEKKKEVIEDLLVKGIEPSTYEVSRRVREFFDRNIPGLPYYKPVKAVANETSDPIAYDKMFKSLSKDIDTVYKASLDQSNKLLASEEYYMAEKEILQSELDKLDLRLQNLADTLDSGAIAQSKSQVFDNFSQVEIIGESERNIPYTTAFVDLIQRRIYTDKVSYAYDRHDLSEATIEVSPLTPNIGTETAEKKEYILKDTVNEAYTFVVNSSKDEGTKVGVDVKLKSPKETNTVTLDFVSPKPLIAHLSISSDGINYTDLYSLDASTRAEWCFETTTVRYIKIILEKKEADGLNDSIFQHYFILKSLSASNNSFLSKSVYVSKAMQFEDVIDTITIKANHIIFPGTQIYYHIGLDNELDKVSWDTVENNKPYTLGLLSENNKIITDNTDHFGEKFHFSSDGTSIGELDSGMYKICKLGSNINENSTELSMGYQMWLMERFEESLEYEESLAEYEYNRDQEIVETYVDNENYHLSLEAGKVIKLEQYVYCEEDVSVNDKYIALYQNDERQDDEDLEKIIIIHGSELKRNDSVYIFRLKKGRNKVVILLHFEKEYSGKTEVRHNFNFKEVSYDAYSHPRLKQVSIHDLRHKRQVGDTRHFAIDEKGFIVVKHKPLAKSLSEDNNGIRYMVRYKTLKDNLHDKLLFKDGKQVLNFRVMATLISTKRDMSPQMISYRIIGQ